jgi:hypothetical protein
MIGGDVNAHVKSFASETTIALALGLFSRRPPPLG